MSAPDLATCAGNAIRPGYALYVAPEENLAINVWAIAPSIVVTLRGRLMTPDGRVERIEFNVPATNGRAVTTTVRPLGEGWLIGLTASVSSGAPVYGAAYVTADLVVGLTGATTIVQQLIAGYVTANARRNWPDSRSGAPFEGQGNLRVITGTDPAAGVEISETVPVGARWRFVGLRATFVPDATVANRVIGIVFDDGANVYAGAYANFNNVASTTVTYYFTNTGINHVQTSIDGMISTPANIVLAAGHRIRTLCGALQAGDNWGPPVYEVEEWLDAT